MKTIIVILKLADNELLAGFHCMKGVQIRSFFWSVFSAFGLNTERYGVSLRIQSNTGKYEPEKTPYLDTFHAVSIIQVFICRHSSLTMHNLMTGRNKVLVSLFPLQGFLHLKYQKQSFADVLQIVVLENFTKFLENTYVQVSLIQVFSSEFCEIFNNTFFTKHLRWLHLKYWCTFNQQNLEC